MQTDPEIQAIIDDLNNPPSSARLANEQVLEIWQTLWRVAVQRVNSEETRDAR